MEFAVDKKIKSQIKFILEADKLKKVLRKTSITDRSRQENSAEHSWHAALIALVFSEYANEKIDTSKVIKMLLLHDLVEIEVGDTFLYDDTKRAQAEHREAEAAKKIFGMLPDEQAQDFAILWHEFEGKKTAEARFAKAIDRFAPLLMNYMNDGDVWMQNGISSEQCVKKNIPIKDGSEKLWNYAHALIQSGIEKGLFAK